METKHLIATQARACGEEDEPEFSIFIPVWNGSEFLAGAIQSVLDQSYAKWELIIGDNASSEDLESIVAQFADPRIHYHRWTAHTDIYENFNRTATLCRYAWLQPLCADDRLNRECLQLMAQRIVENETAETRLAAVVTAARRVNRRGQLADDVFYGVHGKRSMSGGLYNASQWLLCGVEPGVQPWNTGSYAISRAVLAEMGSFFRPEAGLCADHELVLRLGAFGNIAYIEEELLAYTVTAESDGNSRSAQERSSGDPVPSMAAAYLSALKAHEYRRPVSAEERLEVRKAVADTYVRRAAQHRYRAGGQGRRGAFRDLVGAVQQNPRLLSSPQQLLLAAALLIAPSRLLAMAFRGLPRNGWLTNGLSIASRQGGRSERP